MLEGVKKRSQSALPEATSGKDAPAPAKHQTRSKYQLEPLEPRVLLSGDSLLIAAVAQQVLQDPQVTGSTANNPAVVHQLDATSVHSSAADASAAGESSVSVAWGEGWQTTPESTAPDAADAVALTSAPAEESTDASQATSASQAVQLEAAATVVAVQGISNPDDDSSLGISSEDDQIASFSIVTQLPRAPPADDAFIAAIAAVESISINALSPTDSSELNEGGLLAFESVQISEQYAYSQPRAPPASDAKNE